MSQENKTEKLPVSLVGLKHEFGEQEISNSEMAQEHGVSEEWIEKWTNVEKRHEWERGIESALDATQRNYELLLDESGIEQADISAVFGTTNEIYVEGKLVCESMVQEFAQRADFNENIKVWDDSFGCGGSAKGIENMHDWLASQPENTYALYVSQDSSRAMTPTKNVDLLFSDAIHVSLWTNGPDGIAEIKQVFSDPHAIEEEDLSIHTDGENKGQWVMDGKNVVKSAKNVPSAVAERMGIDLEDYIIVPHQPNAKLLEDIESKHGIYMHKYVCEKHGNPTCSGSMIALEHVLENTDGSTPPEDEREILVMPFGAGGMGGFILKRKGK